MRVSADFSDISAFEVCPKNIYNAHIDKCENTKSKAQNFMHVLTWMIEDGDYNGKTIKFDNVVYSGTGKDGKPISPFNLAGLLDAIEISWECADCHKEGVRDFYWSNGEDGLKKGHMYCPDCKQPAKPIYDTDHFFGARCRIAVDVAPIPDTDRQKNEIRKYLKLAR